eukprot:symbB.v1.2.002896.t3/scaffold156.1/size293155/8
MAEQTSVITDLQVVASLSPWSSAEHLLKTLASQRDLRLTVASFTTSSPTSPTSPTSTFSWWMVIGSLERMKEKLLVPNVVNYTPVIASSGAELFWQKSLEVLWGALLVVKGKGNSATCYNFVLSACDKSMKWQHALEIFTTLKSKRLEATLISFNTLMSALGGSKKWQHALHMMRLQQEYQVQANAITYACAMDACLHASQWRWTILQLTSTGRSDVITETLMVAAQVQVSLQILWTAALPRLATESKSSHALASRVALLDALLRGADDELLLSEAVRSAMDEFMVQRVDLDLSALGEWISYQRQISPYDWSSQRQISSAVSSKGTYKEAVSPEVRERQALVAAIERDYAKELQRISNDWILTRALPKANEKKHLESDIAPPLPRYVDVAEVLGLPNFMLSAMLAAKCRDQNILPTKERQQRFAEYVFANCAENVFQMTEAHLGAEFAKALALTLAVCTRYTELNLSGNALCDQGQQCALSRSPG